MSISNTKRKESFFKVRRIKIQQFSDRGTIFTTKNLSEGFVEFESLLEEGLYLLLDHDPHCIDLESQPVKIPHPKKKRSYFVPDTWAKFRDGKQFIFDVKHQDYFASLKNDPEKAENWNLRAECVKDFCERNGLFYELVTDDEIWSVRYENVNFFRKNKRIPELLTRIKQKIEEILFYKNEASRIDLAIQISKEFKLDVKQVIPVIDHLIYFDYFFLDFQRRITDNTILSIKSNSESKIIPLYLCFSEIKRKKVTQTKTDLSSFKIDSTDPNNNSVSRREFLALPEHFQKEILKRIKLLEIFKLEDLNTKKIKAFAKENKIGYTTLYRWKKRFEQLGWRGLIPNYEKAGRKKGFSKELEDLIQKVIEEKYLVDIQPSIKGCYRFLEIECKKGGLTPPHYDTFRHRVQDISSIKKTLKRRGRKVKRDQFKSHEGEYPFGKYPLDLIEFDHTDLDVILVDRIERKPIPGPKLTIAIDVYSRMIYGFYLSFDAQNYLAVGMCFLNGILPKDQITKHFMTENSWSIYGLPTHILLDNAKEFLSDWLFEFCKLYDIDMRFNPPRRPDLKPHVERVIKTINEAIRDDLIKGYRLPLTERRKTQYNPEKKAELTIEEFETWLIHWIVDDYHQRIHEGLKRKEGIKISPAKRYEQGLAEADGRTVGLPTIPMDWEQLRFDALPFDRRKLHREGIKMFGLEYNAPIIAKLRGAQNPKKKKYIIRYDPRDIREVYLWADSLKTYYKIPLKDVYFS